MITKDMQFISKKTFNKTNFKAHTVTSESVRLGVLLAIVGGFLDAYTFICRGGVFANAETGNIVLVGVHLTNGNLRQASMAFLPILAFIIGVFVSEQIKHYPYPSFAFVKDTERIILIIEIIVLFIVGFIPTTVPHILVTTTISFVSSVQISSFRKLVDSPYSTTMCTGNLRTACQATYIAFIKKDKNQALKALRYGIIIFSFIIGACLGGFFTTYIGVKSIWISALILIFAVILFTIDDYRFRKNK